VAVTAALAPISQASAATPQRPRSPAARAPAKEVRLSNEWSITTWAYGLSKQVIYARASIRARRIGRVRLENQAGFPEIYVLLSERLESSGADWVQLRVPGRPNGRIGWVRAAALGSFEQTHWAIVVSLRARRLSAYLRGRLRFRAPVGVGKPSTPTPVGHFWVSERLAVSNRSSPYWPYVLGTSDYSTLTDWPGGGVVGIHGDFGEPQWIPGDPSHGCVRMLDPDILWLARHVTLGTPVEIRRG